MFSEHKNDRCPFLQQRFFWWFRLEAEELNWFLLRNPNYKRPFLFPCMRAKLMSLPFVLRTVEFLWCERT